MFWQLLKLIFANFRNSNFAYFRKFPLLKPIKELATLDILIGFNLGNAKFSFLIGKNSFSQLPKQNWLFLASVNATKNHLKYCNFVTFLYFVTWFHIDEGSSFLKLDSNISFAVATEVKPGFTVLHLIGQGEQIWFNHEHIMDVLHFGSMENK